MNEKKQSDGKIKQKKGQKNVAKRNSNNMKICLDKIYHQKQGKDLL